MTQWLPLSRLSSQVWHTPAVARMRDAINVRIEAQLKSREQLARVGAELQEQDLLEIDAGALFQADSPALNRFGVIQSELRLRLEIDKFYLAEKADREAAVQAALKLQATTEQTLRAGLEKLGWTDSTDPQVKGSIQPGILLSNPKMRQLRDELRQLSQSSDTLLHGNRQDIETLRNTLEEMRRAALQPA